MKRTWNLWNHQRHLALSLPLNQIIMKNSLINRLPLLKVLTVVSFLIVYIPGEKISVFMFMSLILSPFFVLTGVGAPGMIFPGLHPLLAIPIDVLTFSYTFYSIYNLLRRRSFDNMRRTYYIQNLFNILIFYVWVIRSVINPNNNIFSLATVAVFFVISMVTIYSILSMRVNTSESALMERN